MTAKEMFEALGYHLRVNDGLVLCYDKFCDSVHEQITFSLKTKEYDSCFFDGEEIDLRDITIEEHQAITKQMKELGWIKDQPEKLEIKSDGLKTDLFIDGVKQEKLNYIVYTHIAGNDPILTTSKEVRFISDREKDNHE